MRLAAARGHAMLVLVTIFACTRVSLAIRVTQTSGRKNGESFSCSSSFSSSSTCLSALLFLRLLLGLFPLYRYLYLRRCFFLLPLSSLLRSDTRLRFPCSAGRTGIFVLLGFTVLDLPWCLPSLRFASTPILPANILQFPLRSSSCFLLASPAYVLRSFFFVCSLARFIQSGLVSTWIFVRRTDSRQSRVKCVTTDRKSVV